MALVKLLIFSGVIGLAVGRRIRLDVGSSLSARETGVAAQASVESKAPPAGLPLFGQCGEKCDSGEKCVLVADSYGILRPARLDKHSMSPEQAAIALLQDQYAMNKHINGTAVTPDNVAALAGVEPFAELDGQEVPLDVLSQMLGSRSHELSVRWRPVPGFRGALTHTHAMVQLSTGTLDEEADKWITWSNVTHHFKKVAQVAKQFVSYVTDSVVIKKWLDSVKDVLGSLSEFFACLRNLPEKYHMGGIDKLLKMVFTSPKGAVSEIFDVWVKPPLSTIKDFVSKEQDVETNVAQNVWIGDSKGSNEKCVNVPSVGSLLCDVDAGNAAKRIKGGDAPDTFEIKVVDHSRVCARRTDSPAGWDIDLLIKCTDSMEGFPVIMGRSTGQKKCINVAANGLICSKFAANHGNRLDRDKNVSMTFEVSVDDKATQICVERTDAAAGWDLDLKFECHATSYMVDLGTILEGSWKFYAIERAWVLMNDMTTMPNMEVGKCVQHHIMWPMKAPTADVVMLALTFIDGQVREFFNKLSSFLQRSLTGLLVGGFAGVDFADLAVVSTAAANEACMKELETAAMYRQRPGVNLTATMLKPVTAIAPAVARKTTQNIVMKIAKYVTYDIFSPMIRVALGAMQDAIGDFLLLLDGICGVIPEIGGLLCDTIATPLNSAIVYMQEPMYNEAVKFVMGLFTKLGDKIAEWIAGQVTDIAQLATKLVVDTKQKIVLFIEEAIAGVVWIGRIVQKDMVHRALDVVFVGILDFIGQVIGKMAPDVENQMQDCLKLRKVIVGLA